MKELLGEKKRSITIKRVRLRTSQVIKNLPVNAKDTSLVLGLGRFRMPWSI